LSCWDQHFYEFCKDCRALGDGCLPPDLHRRSGTQPTGFLGLYFRIYKSTNSKLSAFVPIFYYVIQQVLLVRTQKIFPYRCRVTSLSHINTFIYQVSLERDFHTYLYVSKILSKIIDCRWVEIVRSANI